MIKNTVAVLILFLLLFCQQQDAGTKNEEKQIKFEYNEAKRLIMKKEWRSAIEALQKIVVTQVDSSLKDNAIYWLAYSLRKSAARITDREKQVEKMESAIEKLNELIEKYPQSSWVDDGKMLRIEIAEELVKRGLGGYKKIIDKSSREESEEAIKIYALDALLNVEDKKAFDLLQKMILGNNSIKLKKRAIFVLSQKQDKRIIPMLTNISTGQFPEELKMEAIFWIGQLNGQPGLTSLLKIYQSVKKLKLKKRIVFAIAQTGNPGVEALISIYKQEKQIELKKKILFWLGQSKSKKAQAFLEEILFN